MNDLDYDKLLKISTTGRDDSQSDLFNYPYEATPYVVLERLAGTGYIHKQNTLIDFGSGKGRVGFFLSFVTKCTTIGVEFYDRLYYKALMNKENAIANKQTWAQYRVHFKMLDARNLIYENEYDRFYFFNPFSKEVFKEVLEKIVDHYLRVKTKMYLFFYYPDPSYIKILEYHEHVKYVESIDFQDIFKNDEREELRIYQLM